LANFFIFSSICTFSFQANEESLGKYLLVNLLEKEPALARIGNAYEVISESI